MSRSTGPLEALGGSAFDLAQRWLVRRDAAAAEAVGARLGRALYRLDSKHRKRTRANLRLAFPEWDDAQVERTAKGVFEHFGRVYADFARGPLRPAGKGAEAYAVTGEEHLRRAEAEGRGVLLVTGHFGNFERLCHWVVASGRRLTVVARDANQGPINSRMLRLREGSGVAVLSRGAAARGILSALRDGQLVGLLPDQNAGETFVPFFGKPCGTVTGPAVMHARTKAPIVPMFGVRLGPDEYRVEIGPALAPLPAEDPIDGMTAAVNSSLEAIVRRYPSQWLWMHDRWKSARQAGLL